MALLTRQQLQEAPEFDGETSLLREIPEGAAGIRVTLDEMVRLTRNYRTDPAIRQLAESILSAIPARNYWAEVQGVRDWVANNIRYTMDIDGVETIKTPLELLRARFGDCDDMSLLAGVLLQSIGHPVRYVATGPDSPDNFEHVYVETKIGPRWVSVETTEDVSLGWQPPDHLARMVRHV